MSKRQRRPESRATIEPSATAGGPTTIHFDNLNDRQSKGFALYNEWLRAGKNCASIADDAAIWSRGNDGRRVERAQRSDRGTIVFDYRCTCPDFVKVGEIDCLHIVAEKIRRGELVVEGASTKVEAVKKAARRPARHRKANNGRSLRSTQRDAREEMDDRIPELVVSLGKAYQRHSAGTVIPIRPRIMPGGRCVTPHATRAQTLLYKIMVGKSADAMRKPYRDLIAGGKLRLEEPPHQNTLTEWMNDERLTPILQEFLRLTSLPFRKREIGVILDSSKVSQLRNAHARWVEYEGDERDDADWMKCHALVGVETLVVIAVQFSGSFGKGTHDINYLTPLVESGVRAFDIKFALADKAYLSVKTLDWLWGNGIRAAIQLKKGWFREGDAYYSDAVNALVHWHDANNNRDFDAVYRLRPKIEALFSILKRLAGEHVWSRGRHIAGAKNANTPCTAWVNETLCKFIYLNLRTTVTLEHETGYVMDYMLPDRHFPEPNVPLLTAGAA